MVSRDTETTSSTLAEARVKSTLDRLHRAAKSDVLRLAFTAPLVLPDLLGLRKTDPARLAHRMRETYIPVSREQGKHLYLTARALDAKRVVEFGTSFGVSTLYLAAALRDNGGGTVIGTEIEPTKHARATANLEEAGLSAFADVRLGDAVETLANVDGPIDLVLLDGWKDLYLPILKMLKPRLRPRAVVLADNIYTFKRSLRPYVDYVQSETNGFVSTTLDLADGFELSVYTG